MDTNILFKSPILKLYCDQSNQAGTQDPIDPKTKFEINKKFCLGDLEKISDQDLETKVFVAGSCPDNLNLDDDLVLNTKFLRVKKQTFMLNSKERHIFMICEISTLVRFERLLGEKRLTEIVNALVSHDMRNPLNSIMAMIDKISLTSEEIEEIINDPGLPDRFKESLKNTKQNIDGSCCILKSSSKQLSMTVNDMLSLA